MVEQQRKELGQFDLAKFPHLVVEAGAASMYAYEEFFNGEIRNPHTRRAYRRHVHQFLAWCQKVRGRELAHIRPLDVSDFLDGLEVSIPSKHQVRSALNHFFDFQVKRHAIPLNPVTSVRNEKFARDEGKTPIIRPQQVRSLFQDIDISKLIGLRDRAILYTLGFTAARVGAVASLRLKDLHYDGEQWMLRFREKRGREREVPVQHELQRYLFAYIDACGLRDEPADRPLFRTFDRRTDQLVPYPHRSGKPDVGSMTANDIRRMMKRRLKAAGLPPNLSPHSFRVAIATNLLVDQGLPLEDVQTLLGHSDPRTTKIYRRAAKRITRNLVERITLS